MSVLVYLTKFAIRNPSDHRLAKIKRFCDAVGLADKMKPLGMVDEDEVVAIRLHSGEAGNNICLRPTFVRQVADCVKATGARPSLTGICTFYKSIRHNAMGHLETAYRHGFTPYVVNAPATTAGGVTSRCYEKMAVNLKHPASVRIAQAFLSASTMVILSHFRGHAVNGPGDAVRNLAMGCAPQARKISQHGRNVVIYPKYIGYRQCVSLYPRSTLSSEKAKKSRHAVIDKERCVDCYERITACEQGAIGIDTPNGYSDFIERIAEYTYGMVKDKEGRICYLNFLLDVIPQCDYVGWSEPTIAPDLGILASEDPVALDTTCFDLMKEAYSLIPLGEYGAHSYGCDRFPALHPNARGWHQVEYTEPIDMGSRDYELIAV